MDELNRQFRNKFPKIRKDITLSKIRRLKNDMVQIFIVQAEHFDDMFEEDSKVNKPVQDKRNTETSSSNSSMEENQHYSYVEVYTLAVAWILFETLILKNLVRKHNRRVYLAVCILICFKQF